MGKDTPENLPVPGPPLRNGQPRKVRFAPRPNRKKRPKELVRNTTFGGKVNMPYRQYLGRLCAHLGVDPSGFIRGATDILAESSGFEPPPPWDLAESATPEMPGLTADAPPSA
jgi:hypothetical protein